MTVSGTDRVTETYNASILRGITAALKRVTKKTPIRIHSYNRFVLNAIVNDLPAWRANGYQGTKGPLKNAELWKALDEELERVLPDGQLPEIRIGEHSYHQWMIAEMKRCSCS